MKSQKLFHLLMGMLFFLFAFQQMEAQNVKEDSLLQLLIEASDQQSIDLYLNLWEATAYNNPAKAADYADQALQLAEKLNDELNIGNAFQKMAGGFLNENNLDKAEEYYKLSSNRFEAVNHVPGLMNNRYNEAIIHYYRAQYQDAIDDFNASIEMGSEVGDSLHIAAVLNSIGLIHNQQGDFVLGEQALYKAVRLFRNSPDRARYADALNYLTASLVGQGYHERAVEILKQAIEIYEDLGDKVFLANSENDLGYNLIFLDEFEEAKKHLYRCLEIAKEVNGELLIGTVYSNLALIKEKESDLDSALYFLSLSKPMFKKLDLIQKYRADQLHIARIYMRQDRPSEAEKILNQVIPAIDTLPFKDLQLETYNNMAILQSDKGNYRQALEYREKTAAVKDSILNQEKARALAEMRTIFETAEKDREIDALERQAQIDELKQQRLWISLGLLSLLAGLIVYILTYRAKKAAQLRKIQAEQEAVQRKNLQLEKKQLKDDLEYKQKELTGEVLSLTRQQETIQDLIRSLEEFKKICDPGQKAQLDKLIRQLQNEAQHDPNWDRFLETFREVHADFIEALTQQFGKLTSSELRLASLLKMNLSSKDIAGALNISDEGVKKGRYRLRKKLNLRSEQDLQSFLLAFPEANVLKT